MTSAPFRYSTPLLLSFHFVPHEFIHLFPFSSPLFISWPLCDLAFLITL